MDQEHDIQESLQMQTAVSIMENKENLTDEQLRTLATDAECRSHCEMLEDVSRILNAQKMTLPDVEEEWNKFKNRERISEGKEQKEDIRNGLPVRSPRVTPIYIYLAAAAAILAVIMLIPWKKAEIKDVVTASADSGRVTTIIEATQELEGITITSGHKTYTIENQETSTQSILAQLSKEDKETVIVTIPRGKVYSMQLPDGSQVWLNADTRLVFPPTFDGSKERRVRLDGEAYFKVAKDAEHPFIVEMGNTYAKVLGTEFNVRNVENEVTHVTLVSGSVEVGNHKKSTLLRPGKDAQIDGNGSIILKDVDVDPYIYWKNGSFYFDNASIDRILTDIGRWYNVTIKLEDQKLLDYKFHFIADRSDSLNQIIEMLNQMDKVTIRRQGNTLYVK